MEHSAIIVYDNNQTNNYNMSSLNQLISEIAHSVQQPDSVPVRRAIRQGIIHARNELIRHSFANHNYTDQVLKQRFKISISSITEDDINHIPIIDETNAAKETVKVTTAKVPRPVRLDNNLPFHTVKTAGYFGYTVIPHVSQGATRFYKHLPGMSCGITYDYINDYIYVIGINPSTEYIIVESVFEYPHEIDIDGDGNIDYDDDNEFFLPEDLVNAVKKLTLETFNVEVIRETNEIPKQNIIK